MWKKNIRKIFLCFEKSISHVNAFFFYKWKNPFCQNNLLNDFYLEYFHLYNVHYLSTVNKLILISPLYILHKLFTNGFQFSNQSSFCFVALKLFTDWLLRISRFAFEKKWQVLVKLIKLFFKIKSKRNLLNVTCQFWDLNRGFSFLKSFHKVASMKMHCHNYVLVLKILWYL